MKTGSDSDRKLKLGVTETGAIRLLCFLWAFVLIQHAVFVWMGVRIYMNPVADEFNPFHHFSPVLAWASFGGLALIPWSYWRRNQRYKANWQGSAITPRGYVQGMSEVFAALLLVAPVSFLGILSSHHSWLSAIPLLVAVVVHVANFPSGKPMRPTPPRLGEKEG